MTEESASMEIMVRRAVYRSHLIHSHLIQLLNNTLLTLTKKHKWPWQEKENQQTPLWITQELIRISESNRDDHRHEWLRFPKSKYSDRYRYRKKTTSRPDRMIIINWRRNAKKKTSHCKHWWLRARLLSPSLFGFPPFAKNKKSLRSELHWSRKCSLEDEWIISKKKKKNQHAQWMRNGGWDFDRGRCRGNPK